MAVHFIASYITASGKFGSFNGKIENYKPDKAYDVLYKCIVDEITNGEGVIILSVCILPNKE
jgi:hypothetical protein